MLTPFGIGLFVIKAENVLSWDGEQSYDAALCFCILWMPILPVRTVHVHGYRPNDMSQFQVPNLPLRWSSRIVAKAVLRQWSLGIIVAGGIASIFAASAWE